MLPNTYCMVLNISDIDSIKSAYGSSVLEKAASK